jgi:peptide/nickel transport system permease protein
MSGVGVTMIIGIPIGIYAALRKGRTGDRVVSVISLFLSAIPPYSIAMILALSSVFPEAAADPSELYEPAAYSYRCHYCARRYRLCCEKWRRSSMLEVLEQPYITTLRSKACGEEYCSEAQR